MLLKIIRKPRTRRKKQIEISRWSFDRGSSCLFRAKLPKVVNPSPLQRSRPIGASNETRGSYYSPPLRQCMYHEFYLLACEYNCNWSFTRGISSTFYHWKSKHYTRRRIERIKNTLEKFGTRKIFSILRIFWNVYKEISFCDFRSGKIFFLVIVKSNLHRRKIKYKIKRL